MMENSESVLFHVDYSVDLEKNQAESNWIRMKPYGVQISPDGERPLLLLKDQSQELVLPVRMSPLEAGVAITQSNPSVVPTSPHGVAQSLLTALGLNFSKAMFTEIRGSHQYLLLVLQGSSELKNLRVRADEAMSFCLHLQIPLYATRAFIEHSKIWQVQGATQIHNSGRATSVSGGALRRTHKYVM